MRNNLIYNIHNNPNVTINGKTLLTEKEAAASLSISVKWLQNKRYSGGGIPFVKLGRAVRYSASDIFKYQEQNTYDNTSTTERNDNV